MILLAPLVFCFVVLFSMSDPESSRARMLNEISEGLAGDANAAAAGSGSLLIRGCDPQMAARAVPMIQGAIGDRVEIVAVTDDDEFFKMLSRDGPKWTVVMFAPG